MAKNYEEIIQKLALIADMLVNTNLRITSEIEINMSIGNDDYINLYLHISKNKNKKIPTEFVVLISGINFRIKRYNAS